MFSKNGIKPNIPRITIFADKYLRARLHQSSASTQSQRCHEAGDTAFVEINGVAPE